MNASPAKLMVAVADKVAFIKVNGKGDFNLSIDLKKLFNELRQRGFKRFVLELCDCVMMDSTFLGLLAGIALDSGGNNGSSDFTLELINPSPRIEEVLENLGVIELFKIVRCEDTSSVNYEPLAPVADKSKTEITRGCLEAHQTLMGIDPRNVRKFKDVTQFLAEDLKRLELAEKK